MDGIWTSNDKLVLNNVVLSEEERRAIHRRGIETIVASDGQGGTITTTNQAPVYTGLHGDRVYMVPGLAVFLDKGQNATLVDDDGILSSLSVQIASRSDPTDFLGINQGTRISLSNGMQFGSVVSIDGVAIGTITIGENYFLQFSFNEHATGARSGARPAPDLSEYSRCHR